MTSKTAREAGRALAAESRLAAESAALLAAREQRWSPGGQFTIRGSDLVEQLDQAQATPGRSFSDRVPPAWARAEQQRGNSRPIASSSPEATQLFTRRFPPRLALRRA